MVEISDQTLRLIKKACKGKKHLKLTIGYLSGNDVVVKVFNELGEIDSPEKYYYEIGSITKTFTTSLLAKNMLENKLSLEDSICKYVQGLNRPQYYPTLRRLATHSSGYSSRLPLSHFEYFKVILNLICGAGDFSRVNPIKMDFDKMKYFMENIKLKDTDYPWQYSNFGMALVGHALGVVSEKEYGDAMTDFLTNELGLNHTYLGITDANLHGYDQHHHDCGNWSWGKSNLIASSGAISSTANDLLKYAKLNMKEDHPYLPNCHKKHGDGNKDYDMGLGWWIPKENPNVSWHGGGTGCFSSYLGIDRDQKVATVVLANYRLGRDDDQNIGFSLLQDLQNSRED